MPWVQTSTNAWEAWSASIWSKNKKARLPCWPPRGQRWIWGILCTQARKHTNRDPPWLLNPGQTSPKVQNSGYQWPHEKGFMSSKNVKHNKPYLNLLDYHLIITSFKLVLLSHYWITGIRKRNGEKLISMSGLCRERFLFQMTRFRVY